jgi:hypothetical protein
VALFWIINGLQKGAGNMGRLKPKGYFGSFPHPMPTVASSTALALGTEAVNTVISSSISAAGERMRRHRQRRRDKLRCLIIELRESEIDELIRRGLLPPEGRDDPEAVSEGIYAFFDRALTRDA